MLFQWDMGRQKPSQIEKNFWRSARAADSTRKFANQLFEGAVADAEATDKQIERQAKNWRLDRMATIDRNILRLAVHEMQASGTPPKVALNEALELAKKFSSAEAAAFLNGILDAILKAREA